MNESEAFIEYRLTRSDRAFAALVASQIDLAYSIALRRVRDAHLADDVTQAVFIILAEKAPMLPPSTNLSGWIFRTTQYVAKNALRSIARRRRHEGAYAKTMIAEPDPAVTAEAIAAIDLALTRLGKTDQEAVILKFYRGKSWTEVGDALGLTEEAARKRIHRALARLRAWLPADLAAAPAIILTTHAVRAAPPHLAASVLQNVAAHAAPHASVLTLAKGTLLATTQIKIAAIAAVLILAVIPASLMVMHALSTAAAAPIPAPPKPPGKLPFTLSKETTGITSPLHDDGTVDYVAALNERYGRGVTPDNNAFIDWLQIVGTESAGFQSQFQLWRATNGAGFFPEPRLKTQFLKLSAAEQTPATIKVWQPFLQYLAMKQGQDFRPPPFSRDEIAAAAGKLWTQKENPDIAGYLDRQDMFLNAIVSAADKPFWWMPAVANDDRTLMAVLWPEIVAYAPLGDRLENEQISSLCARATFRIKNGDFDGFKRDVLAVKRIARRVASGPSLFERQSGAWIDTQAIHSIGAAAGAGVLSADQCAELIQSLDALDKMPDMSETIDVTERWINLDLAAVVATGKFDASPELARRNGDKRFASVDRDAVDWDSVLKEINSAFDDGVTAMHEPRLRLMMQKSQALALNSQRAVQSSGDLHKMADETQAAYSHRVAEAIMTIWPTQLAYRIIEEEARSAAMQDSMLKALLAIAQTRAETGKWPQSPDGLPPDIYSQDAADPVKFQVNDSGAMLYSVGPNSIDDGGMSDTLNHWDDVAVGAR